MLARITFEDKEIDGSMDTIRRALDTISVEVMRMRSYLGVEVSSLEKEEPADSGN